MLCAEAVFLQLDSDAEREWQNRIYGERKTHKQMASLHPSCSTPAGNMPYFRKLMPNYCFGFPMGRAPLFKTKYLFHCCPHIFKAAPQFLLLLPLNSHSGQGTRKKQKCLRKKRKKTAINLPKPFLWTFTSKGSEPTRAQHTGNEQWQILFAQVPC